MLEENYQGVNFFLPTCIRRLFHRLRISAHVNISLGKAFSSADN